MDRRGKIARDDLGVRFLRLVLLDRAASVAPGGKTAADMGDRLQSNILGGFGGQRRAQAARAMKDEFLVLLENRLGVGARGIEPEFQHAAGTGERAGYAAVAFDLTGIADIDDHDIVALRLLDRIGGADGFDLGIGLIDQGLDAAVDGLGHCKISPNSVIPASRYRAPRNDAKDVTAPIPSSRSQDLQS